MKKRRKGVLSTVERLLNVWEYGGHQHKRNDLPFSGRIAAYDAKCWKRSQGAFFR